MEYLKDRGSYTDVPVDEIVAAMRMTYGNDRVERWIAAYETAGGGIRRNFAAETIYKP